MWSTKDLGTVLCKQTKAVDHVLVMNPLFVQLGTRSIVDSTSCWTDPTIYLWMWTCCRPTSPCPAHSDGLLFLDRVDRPRMCFVEGGYMYSTHNLGVDSALKPDLKTRSRPGRWTSGQIDTQISTNQLSNFLLQTICNTPGGHQLSMNRYETMVCLISLWI